MRYADSREPPGLLRLLAGWQVKALGEGADFAFPTSTGEMVLVQRKTISDLLMSLGEGRLQTQCVNMARSSEYPILLLEGHWTRDKTGALYGTRWTWDAVWNQLQTLQDIGCRIRLTTSMEHTVHTLEVLADYYARDSHPSVSRHLAQHPYIGVLTQVKGIGVAKAQALRKGLPRLLDVAEAEVEALMNVDGLGPALAQRIYQFWRE